MTSLYQNAIESIQLGLEDYKSNDRRRPLSAVRNLYAGLLLLAKEVLVRAAPHTDENVVLAASLKIIPDGEGGIVVEAKGTKTIDFHTITDRLNDFGVRIDAASLKALSKIRNDIEHGYSQETQRAVQEAIASVFPVVESLFRHLKVNPVVELGHTWAELEEVKAVFNKELAECDASMENILWEPSDYLEGLPRHCRQCSSRLVQQIDLDNDSYQAAEFICRVCGSESDAENLFTNSINEIYASENYRRAKDGEDRIVGLCPECGVEAYVMDGEHNGCAWCGTELGRCKSCEARITPETAYYDDYEICDYCGYKMNKDD